MSRILNPALGIGTLSSVNGPASERVLNCIYIAGLETIVEDNPVWSYGILQFQAFNPFYVATEPVTQLFQMIEGSPVPWFNGTWFPLVLGIDSEVNTNQVVDNIGDVDVWPYLDIAGPGSGFSITNNTTGATFGVDGTLTSGQHILVDMSYGNKSVVFVDTDGTRTNWYNKISPETSMFPLVPGNNDINVGYVSTTGSVTLGYLPHYLSA